MRIGTGTRGDRVVDMMIIRVDGMASWHLASRSMNDLGGYVDNFFWRVLRCFSFCEAGRWLVVVVDTKFCFTSVMCGRRRYHKYSIMIFRIQL